MLTRYCVCVLLCCCVDVLLCRVVVLMCCHVAVLSVIYIFHDVHASNIQTQMVGAFAGVSKHDMLLCIYTYLYFSRTHEYIYIYMLGVFWEI